MAIVKYKVKTDGRCGLVVSGDGFTLHWGHDTPFYNVCRANRAKEALREALLNTGRLKPRAITEILNNPDWAARYNTCLNNNETIRECELLTAQMIAEEIVEKAESGKIQLRPKAIKSEYRKED